MTNNTPGNQPSPATLQLKYIMEAAYYWYRAGDDNDDLIAALHRIDADARRLDLERRGIPVPTPEEVFAYAKLKWPPDQLRAFNASLI